MKQLKYKNYSCGDKKVEVFNTDKAYEYTENMNKIIEEYNDPNDKQYLPLSISLFDRLLSKNIKVENNSDNAINNFNQFMKYLEGPKNHDKLIEFILYGNGN